MNCRCDNVCSCNGVRRYAIMAKIRGGWWSHVQYVHASDADEAAEAFAHQIGTNPPNEIAVVSTATGSNGAFKMYRIKPRAAYEIEAI